MKFLWLFDYDAYFTLPLIVGALFSLGGSGPKWVRRIGIPALFFLSAISVGISMWRAITTFLILGLVLEIPYGDSVRWKLGPMYHIHLFAIGCAGSLSVLPIGSHYLYLTALLTGFLFSFLTFLSQKKGIPWKMVEMVLGFMLGVSLALQLS